MPSSGGCHASHEEGTPEYPLSRCAARAGFVRRGNGVWQADRVLLDEDAKDGWSGRRLWRGARVLSPVDQRERIAELLDPLVMGSVARHQLEAVR